MEQLLNSKTVRGRTNYLVLWQGHASAADSWEQVEHIANSQERVAEYEAAATCRSKALRAHQRAGLAPLAPAHRLGPYVLGLLETSRKITGPSILFPSVYCFISFLFS